MTPNAQAQHRPLELSVTPAMDGCRLAFIGLFDGLYYFSPLDREDETALSFPTLTEGEMARKIAKAAVDQLMGVLAP